MRLSYKKITIIRFNKEPPVTNVDQELQWLGTSLGLFSLRDKDQSCYRVFIALIKAAKKGEGMTSDELAYQLGLTRGTVVHHINNLLAAGIILEKNNRYILRADTLKKVIQEIRHDLNKSYDEMMRIAENIDEKIGL